MQALALGMQKDRLMPGLFECPSDLDMRFLRGLERVWVLLLDLLLSSIGEYDGQHSRFGSNGPGIRFKPDLEIS